jgi:hypothetical protein
MSESYGQGTSTNDFGFAFDRQSIARLLDRHPMALRFIAFEAILLGIAFTIPLLWTSDLFHAIFGMLLSLAILAVIPAVLFTAYQAIFRYRSARGH